MSKVLFFFTILLLFSCSAVHFDHPMPFQGNKLTHFDDLSGTYAFTDTTLPMREETLYNSMFYKDAYKTKDSITLISGIIYFENQQMGYKVHLKAYYNMHKVDTARVIAAHKMTNRTIENNYLILETDYTDTLINLAKQDQLKSFNGTYYLNKYKKEKQWEVYQVTVKEEVLYLGITNLQDKKDLSNYTLESSKLLAVVHLEDDIFSKFVTSGGFKTRLTFKKHGTSH